MGHQSLTVPNDTHDESGRFTSKYDDETFLDALDDLGGTAGTADIADAVGCPQRTAYHRLDRLADEGAVRKQKIGGTVAWLSVDDRDGAPQEAEDRRESAPASDEGETLPGGPDADSGREAAETDDVFANVDFPTGRDREEYVAAIHAARDYLRDHGPASMREIVMNVMPEYPVGYDVPDLEPGDRYRGAWWRRVVKPGLQALPDVEYRSNHGDYRYTGDDDELPTTGGTYDPTEEF